MRTIINFLSVRATLANVTVNQLQNVANDITNAGKGVGYLFLTVIGTLGTLYGVVQILNGLVGLATSKGSNQGKWEKHKEDLPGIIFFTVCVGIFTTWAGVTYFL